MATTLNSQSQTQAVPLQLSLLEQLVGRLPMPYWAASLLLAIVFGPPGFLVCRYFDTSSFNDALAVYFHGQLPDGLYLQVAGLVLWTAFLFFSMIVPRYIRLKVQAAQDKISPLTPEGDDDYRRAFQPVFTTWPTILLALVIGISFTNFILASIRSAAGIFEWFYHLANITLTYLAIGTSVWFYFGSLWGLYRLGTQPLNLRSAYEDSALGVRPFGSLSLSISYAFFGLLSLIVIVILVFPFTDPLGVVVVILTVLGAVMFFLPLLGVRRQMLKAKRALQAAIRQAWLSYLAEAHAPEAAPEELRSLIVDVKQILTLEAAERKAQAVSTWPFDTAILGRLAAIILSILVAIISSRIIKLLDRL